MANIVLEFDRNPNISEIARLQSLMESVQRAFNEFEISIDDLHLNGHHLVDSLTNDNKDFRVMFSDYGKFKVVTANAVDAINGRFENLSADYVQIDQANIGEAWVQDLMVTGKFLADDVNAATGSFSKYLTGVNIVGDNITAGTITTDRLVIRDPDTNKGILYAINNGVVDQKNLTEEQIKRLTLDGKVITAESITADKINVTDLFAQDITATGTITGVQLKGAYGTFSGEIEAQKGQISVFKINDDGLSADLFEDGAYDYSLTKTYFSASVYPEGAITGSERACYISAHALNSDGLGSVSVSSTGNVTMEANGQIQFVGKDNGTGLVRITPCATDYVLTVAGKSSFTGDVSVANTISEGGTKLSDKYATLSTAQTITGGKTFNASNTFDGEQKFSNASYCPSIYDTASGVGCAFKASRGLFNEALIDKLIMTSSTGKIPFYKYTGTSSGSMTGLTEVASINNAGALSCASASVTNAISANTVSSASTMTCGGILTVNAGAIELFHSSTPYIDFHYAKNSADNTSRIIENQSGTLSVNGVYCTKGGELKANKFEVTEGRIVCKPIYSNTVSSATNMYIHDTGTISRTTNTSSRTIKHDIKCLEDESINAENLYDLEVVQFKYNDGIITDPEDIRCGKDLPGFIIENMAEVYPIAVDKPNDNVKEWSWNAQYLIPPMLKLIQDLHKEVEELKGKVH